VACTDARGWNSHWALDEECPSGKVVCDAVSDIGKRKLVAKRPSVQLPQDCLRRIVMRLGPESLRAVRAVCRSWNAAVETEYSYVDLAAWARFRVTIRPDTYSECFACEDLMEGPMTPKNMRNALRNLEGELHDMNDEGWGDKRTLAHLENGITRIRQWLAMQVCSDECTRKTLIAQLTDDQLERGVLACVKNAPMPVSMLNGGMRAGLFEANENLPAWLLADRVYNLAKWIAGYDDLLAAAVAVGVPPVQAANYLDRIRTGVAAARSGHKVLRALIGKIEGRIEDWAEGGALFLEHGFDFDDDLEHYDEHFDEEDFDDDDY
jgi:hypothetical protein